MIGQGSGRRVGVRVRRPGPDERHLFPLIESRAVPNWAPMPTELRVRAGRAPAPIELVAEAGGVIIGVARANELTGGLAPLPGCYNAVVAVDPARGGQGAGRALCSELVERVRERGGRRILTTVEVTDERALAVAGRFGFVAEGTGVAQAPSLEAFDFVLVVDPDATPTGEVRPGVEVVDLAGQAPALTLWAALHELHDTGQADAPRFSEPEPTDLTDFVKTQEQRLADGGLVLVAFEGHVPVAATFADRATHVPVLWTDITVVARPRRGLGLGTHLKAHLLGWAAEHGIERLRTEVRSDNTAMLAVNERLGYRVCARERFGLGTGARSTPG